MGTISLWFFPNFFPQPVTNLYRKGIKRKKTPKILSPNGLPCDCWAFYPSLAPLHQNQQMSQFCPFWGQVHTQGLHARVACCAVPGKEVGYLPTSQPLSLCPAQTCIFTSKHLSCLSLCVSVWSCRQYVISTALPA